MKQYDKIREIIKSSLNGMLPMHTIEKLSDRIAKRLIKEGASIPDKE